MQSCKDSATREGQKQRRGEGWAPRGSGCVDGAEAKMVERQLLT